MSASNQHSGQLGGGDAVAMRPRAAEAESAGAAKGSSVPDVDGGTNGLAKAGRRPALLLHHVTVPQSPSKLTILSSLSAARRTPAIWKACLWRMGGLPWRRDLGRAAGQSASRGAPEGIPSRIKNPGGAVRSLLIAYRQACLTAAASVRAKAAKRRTRHKSRLLAVQPSRMGWSRRGWARTPPRELPSFRRLHLWQLQSTRSRVLP